MNKQQAKKRVHNMVYNVLEGDAKTRILNHIARVPETEADKKRMRDALDLITQEQYDRSRGNIVRARGY